MSIWRFADRFSQTPAEHRITRGEGNTPLVRSMRLGPAVGLRNLWFKLESANPSGSYKDRFAAAAISDMRMHGDTHIVATSSGNTGAALAAYSAAAGMTCEIVVVETAPDDKLRQMRLYGARIYKVRGFGIDPSITSRVFDDVARKAAQPGRRLQISAYKYSPAGMAGVETISHELATERPGIRHVFCPAGGGGLTAAVAKGFQSARSHGGQSSPAVHCVQPVGNDTMATALATGRSDGIAVHCTSAISGLQVPGLIDASLTIAVCRSSGGTGFIVEDDFIWETQARLAREEGLFVEPAAAVSVAGALKALRDCRVQVDDEIVCILSGIGFKDAPSAAQMAGLETCEIVNADSVLTI